MPSLRRFSALLILLLPGGAVPVHGAGAAKLRFVTAIYADAQDSPLAAPEGVAFDGKSVLVVADSGHGRLIRYSLDGGKAIGGQVLVLPEVPFPTQVQLVSSGDILVLDGRLHRLARIGADGGFRGYLPLADAPAGPVLPRAFRADHDDRVYVLDGRSAQVLVQTLDGKLQRAIQAPPEPHGSCSDLTVDGTGRVYLLDGVARQVYAAAPDATRFSKLGPRLSVELGFPTSIASDGRGRLYVCDRNGGVAILAQDGSLQGRQLALGWKEGHLRYPVALGADPDGLVFVADRGNNRVQLFSAAR